MSDFLRCEQCYTHGTDVGEVLAQTGRQWCFVCEGVPEAEWETYSDPSEAEIQAAIQSITRGAAT